MDILYLLIPLSAVLVLAIIAIFGWALHHGQFDDLEREGGRILDADRDMLDEAQVGVPGKPDTVPPRPPSSREPGQA